MKYSLSLRKIPGAEPEGFSKGSVYISQYILTQVKIQTLSISKKDSSSIVLPGWALLVELILHITLAVVPIFFQYWPS